MSGPVGEGGRGADGTGGWRRLAPVLGASGLVLALTLVVFAPVLHHGFLNWDDPDALVGNTALDAPDAAVWAFRTTYMSHYQPLAWLAWSTGRRLLGTDARAHHLMSLALHAANALLVLFMAAALSRRRGFAGGSAPGLGAVAALLFALHPLRVEAVAWASALPYLLALALLLLSVIAYLRHLDGTCREGPLPRRWLVLALLAYAASLLARPIGLGLLLVLLLLDVYGGRLAPARTPGALRGALLEKLPFAVLALVAGLVEAGARPLVSLERVGAGARLSQAVVAPFVYLWRTLAPLGLTPLDLLPLEPRTAWPALVLGSLGLVVVTALCLWCFRRRPEAALLWLAWLALLFPALGLAPSGLQATADRYTYVAGVVPALALAAVLGLAVSRSRPGGRLALGLVAAAAVVALGLGTRRELPHWRDSVSLWSRAVRLDPRNDVALYNLANALAAAGDEAGAAERYRDLLALLPDHVPARRNLALLEAKDLERRAGAAAAAGRLDAAVDLYGEALERDPARLHSRASRGMALAQLGRCRDAVPDLRAALTGGRDEPPLWSALTFCLAAADRIAEARATLEQGLARHPTDPVLCALSARLEDVEVR
jgi:protein O-mannosyl-transferase